VVHIMYSVSISSHFLSIVVVLPPRLCFLFLEFLLVPNIILLSLIHECMKIKFVLINFRATIDTPTQHTELTHCRWWLYAECVLCIHAGRRDSWHVCDNDNMTCVNFWYFGTSRASAICETLIRSVRFPPPQNVCYSCQTKF